MSITAIIVSERSFFRPYAIPENTYYFPICIIRLFSNKIGDAIEYFGEAQIFAVP